VSLAGDVEGAKVLAFSSADLTEGVARVERATLELTAIIEPLRDAVEDVEEEQTSYRFGVETMERAHIRVLTTADLERVAETARRELRV
jgi:ATP-dependent RNA circularization protein (DNA/RNA ligase family)